ncbi:MAG: hypothetical protein GF334_12995 [Candidatus Altiarchaeales archaeon]|nr:hypothetical protein [Candidatus Altiarchaeales archaeon]
MDENEARIREDRKALRQLLSQSESARSELLSKTSSLESKTHRIESFKKEALEILQDLKNQRQQLESAYGKLTELENMKDEFISITTHELKTPLTPIKLQTQMWLSGLYGPLDERQQKSMKIMLRNTERLLHLIDDLMTLAKLNAHKLKFEFQDLDINQLITDVVTDMKEQAEEKNIYLKYEVSEKPLLIHADPQRIMQVIVDLTNNAIKFTDEGGVTIKAKQQRGYVIISVQDTGIGLPQNDLDNIFKRFYQSDHGITRTRGGSGLGLAIVKSILTRHGSRIWVESKKGRGTTFYFSFPKIHGG